MCKPILTLKYINKKSFSGYMNREACPFCGQKISDIILTLLYIISRYPVCRLKKFSLFSFYRIPSIAFVEEV